MFKALRPGIVLATVLALFAVASARPLQLDIVLPQNTAVEHFIADEGTVRSERSANISHIIGVSRKIQLIVNKIMFLQISPDGSVNGTDNDNEYTVLQRASLNNYQIKIQGVVTCNFLCMDRCGLLYGSKEFTDDCIFNEMMESHHFNTYSSAKYSNDKRTLYLALNKKGIPRKVQTKAKASLGKLETYTNVLTKPVSPERVEGLALKISKARVLLGKFLQGTSSEDGLGGSHLFRHHRYQFCPNVPMTKSDEKNSKFRCRKKEKRKKKRKCKDDEDEDDDCLPVVATMSALEKQKKKTLGKCEEEEDDEECQKRLHSVRQKRKSRTGSELDSEKCSLTKCVDDKVKKRKKKAKNDKKKAEKSSKSKCDVESNCSKKGLRTSTEKGPRKETEKWDRGSLPAEDSSTASSLWRKEFNAPGTTFKKLETSPEPELDFATEKSSDDYEDEDPTDKMVDEEEDVLSPETEPPLQSSSSTLNQD